jgi:uncharacterized membrane-anchored protein
MVRAGRPSDGCSRQECVMARVFDARWMVAACATGLLVAGPVAPAAAQEPEGGGIAAGAGWSPGPHTGPLGTHAQIEVPEGAYFLDASATRAFLQANENVPTGNELGAVLQEKGENQVWFAIFTFSDEGYVDDSDKDAIDADALLASMKQGTEQANEERKKRGWTPFNLEGWQTRPFYDPATHNLTWAIRGSSPGETPTINHSVRLLGRRGVMSVQLVADQEGIAATTSDFNHLLEGFSYKAGERYAEFRKGDKMAGYGLAALIGGGAAAAAVKTGFLQKAWKVLLALAFAAAAGLKKLFGGASREEPAASFQPPPVPPAS